MVQRIFKRNSAETIRVHANPERIIKMLYEVGILLTVRIVMIIIASNSTARFEPCITRSSNGQYWQSGRTWLTPEPTTLSICRCARRYVAKTTRTLDAIIETSIEITAKLGDVHDGLTIAPRPIVEISLDCPDCIRRCRTVAIADSVENAHLIYKMTASYTKLKPRLDFTSICLPSGHPFPATIESYDIASNSPDSISFHMCLKYEFVEFHATSGILKGDSASLPRWVRMHFSYACPNCGYTRHNSIQSNLGRPYTTRCKCGSTQYTDFEPPKITANHS